MAQLRQSYVRATAPQHQLVPPITVQPPITFACSRAVRAVGRARRARTDLAATKQQTTLDAQPALQRDLRPPQLLVEPEERPEGGVPIYVAIESDVLSPHNTLGYEEALRVGLKAVRLLGVSGIAVDVVWGIVEQAGPQQYDWTGYRKLFDIIVDMGFKLKVNLCFNSTDTIALPPWVLAVGETNPDIWYSDKAGERCKECLTLGIDEVPALDGRTGVQVYADFMTSFRQEFHGLLASGTITELLIGLGPRGEARYPSHPPTPRGGSSAAQGPTPAASASAASNGHSSADNNGRSSLADVSGSPGSNGNGSHPPPAGADAGHTSASSSQPPHPTAPTPASSTTTGNSSTHGGGPDGASSTASGSTGSVGGAQAASPAAPSSGVTGTGGGNSKRWEYPGIGEFQCYDRYMLASLKACAEQVRQPPWGLGGPHDTGSYTLWPHQSTFFAHNGSWTTPYGRFFLQWYSDLMAAHMDRVVGAAAGVFAGLPVTLAARIPSCYWWHNTASHAPELTAGYYNTSTREGYLVPFKVLASHGAGVHLSQGEARTAEKSRDHCADPERLLLTQRTVAAALHMPVTLENSEPRFDDPALGRLTTALFDPCVHLGIELPPPRTLVFHRMSDAMFEPANWQRFKAFVRKVHSTADDASLRGVASSLASHAP